MAMSARSPHLRRLLAALAVAGLSVAAASCTSSSTPSATPSTSTTTTAAPAPPGEPLPGCDDTKTEGSAAPTASFEPTPLPPPGQMPAGSYMAVIQDRGRLIVGASADTYGMGARDPFTGEIVGFDIDQLKRVAAAIFPDAVRADGTINPERVEFKIVTYAERIPALESGEVDIVAHSMTINCVRWNRIDFSAEYYTASQKVLVPKGSGAAGIEDLGGKRVCTQNGTTSIDRLRNDYPDVQIVAVDDVSDCLVRFQTGEADAISGDDTVLAGFAKQDPFAQVAVKPLSSEPYGMGINKDHPEFVRFVNAVLAKSIADGSWQASYDTWLKTGDDDLTKPPTPNYDREP